ncbi:hypothetical protein SLE2022_277000 [Rubroshorea leprosula]
MCKLNWRLHQEKDKVWSGIFRSKYNIQDCHTRPVATGSPIWKAIIKGYDLFSSGLKWVPHTGTNISFWTNCWATEIPLVSMLHDPHPSDFISITVSDFFTAGDHAFELISYYLPDDISNILKAIPLSIFNDREDSFAWKGTSRGTFTVASAYCLLKNPSTFVEKSGIRYGSCQPSQKSNISFGCWLTRD